jgi:hypothetical protein
MKRNLILAAAAAAAMMLAVPQARAEEFKLPDAAEMALYSKDATRFYSAGVAALDRIDHINAFNNLSKAAQLQPNAVRLNMITAALAMKMGRARPAAEAKPFYDVALACLNNVLRQPGLDDKFIRNVQNRLRVATEESEGLVQRDNKRESIGSAFVIEHNREIATATPTPTPKAGSLSPAPAAGLAPVAAAPAGMPGAVNPYAAPQNPYYGAQNPYTAGATNPYAAGVPQGMPGGVPQGMPGAVPQGMPGGEVPGAQPVPGGVPGVPPGSQPMF